MLLPVARQWLTFAAADVLPAAMVPVREDLLSSGLRFYQVDVICRAIALMQAGVKRILLVLPTGGGKTEIASSMIGSARQLNQRSQFIVHRKELIDQTSKTFWRNGVPHGFIAAGHPEDYEALAILSGLITLKNRLARVLPPQLIILDEAHHAVSETNARVLEAFSDAFVIGLTATPERLDGQGLGDQFDAMVIGPSVAELMEWGFLSQYNYYAPGEPDLVGIHTTAGDFNRAEIGDLMDRPKLIGDTVEHYLSLAKGKPGIIFAASREHSRHIAEAFRAEGIRAAHVDGDSDDRDDIVKAFRAGDLEIMSNVDLFGEGFDVPGVVYAGLARPTKSLALYRQQVGRAFRVMPGKTAAVIADHAGNVFRHGMPDDDVTWSLEGKAARERSAGSSDATAIRQCLVCYRVSPAALSVCPGCGTPYAENSKRQIRTEAGKLSKLERVEIQRQEAARRKEEWNACTSYGDFKRLAEQRGYEDPIKWATVQWKLKKGKLPWRGKRR